MIEGGWKKKVGDACFSPTYAYFFCNWLKIYKIVAKKGWKFLKFFDPYEFISFFVCSQYSSKRWTLIVCLSIYTLRTLDNKNVQEKGYVENELWNIDEN